ncbi:MAG: ATP-binding protein, partial [Terracidiphilus sp.]|jgi:two-component system sensor histidine kinase KdpD
MTISFEYLLLVIAIAVLYGFWQASLMSLLAVLCLDYLFIPPIFHFNIADPMDWVALAEFELTALIVSRLSAKELRNAREAAIHRAGMERLYELSRNSLLLDLRQAPGPQLVVLIHRLFDAHAVALLDMNLGRQDRAGEWDEGEENLAKECFLHNISSDDTQSHTSRRILQAGTGSVGALVIRGQLDSLVVDALASLAAIMVDRYQWFEKEERAETASRSEQLRAAVMDALAHELKTPLTAVHTASSGLLELGGLSGLQRDLVTLIDDETSRLNRLCTRLLQTAKLEAEQMGLQVAAVNVKEVITEVLASTPEESDINRMHIDVRDPQLTLHVDRQLLAMILAQYVNNALKYSTPNTPIDVVARAGHNEVILSVHNFGPTIRIEDRERIFDRFYRAPGLKDAIPGTGIGLSVARKAAEAHHGHVWVISDDKEGTTFFLSIPMDARR